ncbi:unnamed protein product, partial [Tenebrio molitor]
LTATSTTNKISLLVLLFSIFVLTPFLLFFQIRDVCIAITPETLHNVQRSFLNRVDACLLQNGMHVEQFLR